MIWFLFALYVLIASGAIFGLLVAAARHEAAQIPPWVYVACGMLWPVAALPAAAFIAAAWYINREDNGNDGRTDI